MACDEVVAGVAGAPPAAWRTASAAASAAEAGRQAGAEAGSYTHLRAHATPEPLVCRLLLEKKKKQTRQIQNSFKLDYGPTCQ
ncbi:hypothetical protein, partial [Halomonas sp. SL1]|uniref:hypothetical protein n=1 Tax=Halomonas sp. SL1 TaxID=2137478 RepID=UPI001C65C76F